MTVEIVDETGRFRQRRALRDALGRLGTELGAQGRTVCVVLVDDDAIAARNLADRGVDGPTDVLSYPLHESDDVGMPMLPLLGDVFISLDTAARQARVQGHARWREVLTLAAHGLLHLLGYDHPDDASWQAFERAQARVLTIADALAAELAAEASA